jgi:three-Cys-motif partner protein
MSQGIADGTVGPWAREKLDALGQYLDFYTKVLKNQGAWCKSTTFVDAFAGAGTARVRRKAGDPPLENSLFAEIDPVAADAEAEQIIRGSPRVALDVANPFSRYVFIERDPGRAAELEQLRSEYGDGYRIEVRQGTADEELTVLLRGDLGRPGHLGVVFLDPFGMQMSWSVIEGLAATGRVEVIINFALDMAIQRVLARSAVLPDAWLAALDRFFGSRDWYEQAYERRDDLFGSHVEKRADAGPRLLEWYRSRLNRAFGHVSPARLISNTRGNPLYHLIWAGPHKKGLQGADYILRKGKGAN